MASDDEVVRSDYLEIDDEGNHSAQVEILMELLRMSSLTGAQ